MGGDNTAQDRPIRKERRSGAAETTVGRKSKGAGPGAAGQPVVSSESPKVEHPTHIGPYQVLEPLGEGGMGSVYLAQQSQPRRLVALKLIQANLVSHEALVRFEAERQALGRMNHVAVAQVYDGGTTRDGQPYFVMEYVPGEPITSYCDRRRLDLRQRLELFVAVCQGVQHAHQKGIIHRDIKPSNILVTEEDGNPTPKIIDFGIAKALDQPLTDGTLLTGDRIVGTPAYLSPEAIETSAEGSDIDTRCDVYALGVVLYELLAGVRPFTSDSGSFMSLAIRILREEAPSPVSKLTAQEHEKQAEVAAARRLEQDTLLRRLCGELSWITMKAIAKERSLRYESAAELAADVGRYLGGEPVHACPPTASYLAGKFVRRHWVGVVATLLVMLSLVVAAVLSMRARRAAEQAQQVAETRRDQAESLISFMVDDLRSKLDPLGRLDILDDVGTQAMEYFAAVPEEELSDSELSRRAKALYQIGDVRFRQGNLPAAAEVFQDSLALNQALVQRDPENNEWQFGLGQSYFWVGFVERRRGDLDAALQQFRAYLAVAELLVERDPGNLDYQLELAYGHSNLGTVLRERGDLDEALQEHLTALRINEQVAALQPDDPNLQLEVANTRDTIGRALGYAGDLKGALLHFHRGLDIKQRLNKENPSHMLWRRELATSHNLIGAFLSDLGSLSDAETHARAAITILLSLHNEDPSNTRWRRDLATNRGLLGKVLKAQGKLHDAHEELRKYVEIMEGLAEADPSDTLWQCNLADGRNLLASLLLATGDPDDAIAYLESTIATMGRIIEKNPEDNLASRLTSATYTLLGLALMQRGANQDAEEAWKRALALIEPLARSSNDTDLLDAWARPLLCLNRVEEARPIVAKLEQQGYKDSEFIALCSEKGV